MLKSNNNFFDYVSVVLNSKDFSNSMRLMVIEYLSANFMDELDKKFNGSIDVDDELDTIILSYRKDFNIKIISTTLEEGNQIEIITKNQKILFKENNDVQDFIFVEGKKQDIIDINGNNYNNLFDFSGFYDGKLSISLNGYYPSESNDSVVFERINLTDISSFEELNQNLDKIKNNSYVKKLKA